MTTFAFEVYEHQKRRDGTYNIKIRVTHNRKKKYISTPYYCEKGDLTKSLKIKNQFYIDECQKIIRDYRKRLEVYGMAVKVFTIERVYDILTKDDSSEIDLQSFYDSIKHTIKNNSAIQSSISRFIEYTGRERIDVREITSKMLNGWISSMLGEGMSRRTVVCYISNLRNVFNRAKAAYNDEELGSIVIPGSPFSYIQKIQVYETQKRAISGDDIMRIAQLEYKQTETKRFSAFNIAKDLFLLSFALVGINLADLYDVKKDAYKDGRLTYNRTKTKDRRSDMAEIRIKVPYCAMRIIDRYRDTDGTHMLVLHKHYSNARHLNVILSNGMRKVCKEIGVKATFYSARHSWATIAVNDCGIDKYTVHLALNHTDPSTAITDVYIKKDFTVIDKANERVLDFVKLL